MAAGHQAAARRAAGNLRKVVKMKTTLANTLKLIAALVLTLPQPAIAQSEADFIKDDQYLYDNADILEDETYQALSDRMKTHRRFGRVIALRTYETFDEAAREIDLQGHADKMLAKWTEDDPKHAGTMLLIIAEEQGDAVVAIGANYNYEEYRYRMDNALEGINETTMVPERISDTTENLLNLMTSRLEPDWQDPSANYRDPYLPMQIALGLLGVLILGCFVMKDKLLALWIKNQNCPECGKDTLVRSVAVLRESFGSIDGEDEVTVTCTNCGYTRSHKRRIPATKEPGYN